MPTCFLIQPFDGGPFDLRCRDVYIPAVRNAGLEPYRVDEDPSVSIPIEEIEDRLRKADVCLADISLDNPNVWYELGFAIACRTPVVLVCSAERKTRFPFDIQHRHVIKYNTDSTSDFTQLGSSISDRLRATVEKEKRVGRAVSLPPLSDTDGLPQHELALLVTIAGSIEAPGSSVAASFVRQDMNRAGFNNVAVTIGVAALAEKALVEVIPEAADYHGDRYVAYALTTEGMTWLRRNQARLELREHTSKKQRSPPEPGFDEVPF
ncbi:MAG: hypothetical protein ABI972_29685 [Acidobacteriota bacterium]